MKNTTLRVASVLLFLISMGQAADDRKASSNLDMSEASNLPNIILVMCDDMGWGDVGFNGGNRIKTPQLDSMAQKSLIFDRFYSASAVCSPTRGSVVTGRNPYRYGIETANKGHMKPEEFTIYEALKTQGYRTGHFGKWHLGTLTKTVRDSNRGGLRGVKNYAPPWDNGVDVVFATEAKVPTYDPMDKPQKGVKGEFRKLNAKGWWPIRKGEGTPYRTHYWTGPDQMVDPTTLKGDDSKIIMDQAIPFISQSSKSNKPFIAVIWLHAPHLPVVAGKSHTDLYPDSDGFHANYYGCVSAIDDQIGRLRKTLRDLEIAENTLLAFTSDNGPEGSSDSPGSAADYRGRKRSLYEGGIRVPSLIEWPAKIKEAARTQVPTGTMDYFPTIMAITGFKMPDSRPLDGVNLLPLMEGTVTKRSSPIGFLFGGQSVWMNNQFKIYKERNGKSWQLYDLIKDPSEKKDLAAEKPEVITHMVQGFNAWRKSVDNSATGKDYQQVGWHIDNGQDWKDAIKSFEGAVIENGSVSPEKEIANILTHIRTFKTKRKAQTLTVGQSAIWQNWDPIENLGPANLQDAPVLLTKAPGDYWMFGRYKKSQQKNKNSPPFISKSTTLKGFDVPLQTTVYPNQFNAAGGLKVTKGGYHAWQSRDMKSWVHHGPVTEYFSRWVTSAEMVDGKALIYYDFPNDQDPHVYVDGDLTDGEPGENKGMALKDPSHGSDTGFIRDLDGNMHAIFEDWSPISANKRSWDSPLAGHAVSPNGVTGFIIKKPAVDNRTKPTGEVRTYKHIHWVKEDPDNYKTNVAEYNVHEPEQEAYGDWAPICIGGQYYLFGDYDPAGGHEMSCGWFTSPSINEKFTWCDSIGRGHPDPDIAFAEGQFYLATQQKTDYISPGPWVEKVEARVGVDIDNDAKIDHWSEWSELKENYDYIPGFSKQIKRIPAELNLTKLPEGYGFQIEMKLTDTTENKSKPIIENIHLSFK